MGDISIIQMTRGDESFYPIMGPYFGNREIAKELGSPIWDDSDKIWFIATANGKVVGFAAIKSNGKNTMFVSDWVFPELRKQGVYDCLMQERIAYIDAKQLAATATVRLVAVNTFERYGFVVTKKLKNYVKMKREPR